MNFSNREYINDEVVVQKCNFDGFYEVLVYYPLAGDWVCYNRFVLKSDAMEWAQIEENVK